MKLLAIVAVVCFVPATAWAQVASNEIFQCRILPLLSSPNSSSCQECHVAGIGIATFLQESKAATFASLKSSGWIDIENPAQSKLLSFIERHTDNTSDAIQKNRNLEREALTEWSYATIAGPQQ